MDTERADTWIDGAELRHAIRADYDAVAREPGRGFHFHTGRLLFALLGYDEDWLGDVPERTVESFAGTGNPFRAGPLRAGEHVVDIGCGAGADAWIAAKMVGATGRVIGVDMTPAMVEKARVSAAEAPFANLEVHEGLAEELPVPDGWADVVISNGVFNLLPDKARALAEMRRVLRPGGRLQLADIIVRREVPRQALHRIDLWTG
ncbi:MAG: methyltransferase domain-containing protein [Planctomycetes bacterium]|nr:methyltransferase domain-containing protein [Planctomycetota bacterium]